MDSTYPLRWRHRPRVRLAAVCAAAGLLAGLLTGAGIWARSAAPAHPTAVPPAGAIAGSRSHPPVACQWLPEPADAVPGDLGTPPPGEARHGRMTLTLATNLGAIVVDMDAASTPCTVANLTHLARRHFLDGSRCHRLTRQDIFVLQCGDPTGTGTGGPGYRFASENLAALPPAPPQDQPPAPSLFTGFPCPSGLWCQQPAATGGSCAPPSYCLTVATSPVPQLPSVVVYRRGTVAMANADPDRNGSQFFVSYQDSELSRAYTPFGVVASGLDLVDRIAAGGVAPGGYGPQDGRPVLALTILSMTVTPG